MSRNGIMISIEGVDGGGKTTVANKIKSYLDDRGKSYLHTREPSTHSKLGETLRSTLLLESMPAITAAYLFAASRSLHVEEVIKPALEDGKIVLCDRYLLSSLAYQSASIDGIPVHDVLHINEKAIQGIYPDVTLVLDLSIDEMYNRMRSRGGTLDHIESKGREYFEIVRHNFLTIEYPNKHIISAEQSPEDVFVDVMSILQHNL